MDELIARLTTLFERAVKSNTIILLIGTFVGQLMPVLVSPVLTRLFRPSEFGTLGVFSAICMTLIPVCTLRYELALLLVQAPQDVAGVLAVAGIVIVAMSVIAAVIMSLLPWDMFPGLLDLHRIDAFLPIALLAIGAYQVLVYEATRTNQFKAIARTKLIQGFAGPSAQIALGLLGFGTIGLVSGFVLSQSFGSLYLIRTLIVPLWGQLRALDAGSLIRIMRRFIRFPLLSSWSSVLQEAGAQYAVIVLMMSAYGTTVAGYLFLADRIVGRPLLMVSTSVLQSYSAELSQVIHRKSPDIRQKYLRVISIQVAFNLAWCSAVFLLSPYFVTRLFGQDWSGAIVYIQIMCCIYFFQSTMHPVYPTLQLLERQGIGALFEIVRFVFVSAAILFAYAFGATSVTALVVYAVAQAVSMITLSFIQIININSVSVVWLARAGK